MKIRVDEHRCVGSGQCAAVAPEVFDQRERDGIVVLLDAEPPTSRDGEVRKAARLCPAQAIHVVED